MRLRSAIVSTIAWMIVVMGLGLLGVWYMHGHRVGGASSRQRAERLGRGLGTVAALGAAGIWGVWLVKRKRR